LQKKLDFIETKIKKEQIKAKLEELYSKFITELSTFINQ